MGYEIKSDICNLKSNKNIINTKKLEPRNNLPQQSAKEKMQDVGKYYTQCYYYIGSKVQYSKVDNGKKTDDHKNTHNLVM